MRPGRRPIGRIKTVEAFVLRAVVALKTKIILCRNIGCGKVGHGADLRQSAEGHGISKGTLIYMDAQRSSACQIVEEGHAKVHRHGGVYRRRNSRQRP